jgi:hypothetical protein
MFVSRSYQGGGAQDGASAESNLRDSRFSERLRESTIGLLSCNPHNGNYLWCTCNLPHRQTAGGGAHGELCGVNRLRIKSGSGRQDIPQSYYARPILNRLRHD